MRNKPQLSLLAVGVSVATMLLASTTTLAAATAYKGENYKGEAPCPVETMLKDGFYVGVQGGYDMYRLKEDVNLEDTDEDELETNPKLNANGWVGGAFLGYGKYWDNFYLGAEIFANASGAKSDMDTTLETSDGDILDLDTDIKVKSEYGISLLPGIKVNDDTLFYVRLGYNWARVDVDTDVETNVGGFVVGGGGDDDSETVHGFNYGVGIETLLVDNFSLRAEYTYTKYNDTDSGDDSVDNDLKISDNQFMLGLIYHFS